MTAGARLAGVVASIAVVAAVLLPSSIALGQGDGSLPPGGQAVGEPGGIPYSPYLIIVIFAIGGGAYSVHGWYSSKSRYAWDDPRFNWTRLMKSLVSGVGIGLVAYGTASVTEVAAISETLVARSDGTVAIEVFASGCAAAFLVVAGIANTWKKSQKVKVVDEQGREVKRRPAGVGA